MSRESASLEGNELHLIELSVVLVANSNNPSIINPDFLRINKIVNDGYEVKDPAITSPAFSQVAYTNGITISSAPDRIIFTQSDEHDIGEVEPPEIAKRYVECIPHAPYSAVGINPKIYRLLQEPKPVLDMLQDKGSWLEFKDVMPDVQLKTIYKYDKRVITIDVQSTDALTMYQANIHRELTVVDAEHRIEYLKSLLISWEKDLEDFYRLSSRIHQEK